MLSDLAWLLCTALEVVKLLLEPRVLRVVQSALATPACFLECWCTDTSPRHFTVVTCMNFSHSNASPPLETNCRASDIVSLSIFTWPSDRSTEEENGGHADRGCQFHSTACISIAVGVADGSNVHVSLLDCRFDVIDVRTFVPQFCVVIFFSSPAALLCFTTSGPLGFTMSLSIKSMFLAALS